MKHTKEIAEMEKLVEELRDEFNAAISEYEEAVEHPDYYDVEAAKHAMEDAERYYNEAKDNLELEIMWLKF